MSRHPEVKWAERADKVYLTVILPDSKNAKVNVEPDGTFTFSANAGAENHFYELNLKLFDKINVEESKINIGVRSIFCILEKAEHKWWKKLLDGGEKLHNVKVDWDKWVDDDDNVGPSDLDFGGMDFSKLGDMGSMGGMGDLGGMGDMGNYGMGDDLDDSDEEEMSKPEVKESSEGEEGKKVEVQEAKSEVSPNP